MGSLVNILVYENNMELYWIIGFDVVCGILSVIYYLLGRFTFTHESIPLAISFWGLSLVVPVFVGFGVYSIITQQLLAMIDFPTLSFGQYDKLVFSFLFVVSGAFVIIIRTMLLIQSVIVFRYFGEGIAKLDKKVESYWAQGDEVVSESEENEPSELAKESVK